MVTRATSMAVREGSLRTRRKPFGVSRMRTLPSLADDIGVGVRLLEGLARGLLVGEAISSNKPKYTTAISLNPAGVLTLTFLSL